LLNRPHAGAQISFVIRADSRRFSVYSGAMKSILVPLKVNDDGDSGLAAALTVARRFDSYVEGLVVEPAFPVPVGDMIAAIPVDDTQFIEDWRAKAQTARGRFDTAMKQAGIPAAQPAPPKKGSWAGWQETKGFEGAVVGEYGRLFDLIVIGQASEDNRGEVTETCEAALFESGRPMLLAPRDPVKTLGDTVVISWNGSTETARTIGLGMPFIDGAKTVFVLTVEGATVAGPTGEQVADYLSRRDVAASAVTAQPGERSAGEAILEEAAALGADLLFKGAYTHSRLRAMVFGGPTKHILSHANLPVIMAH